MKGLLYPFAFAMGAFLLFQSCIEEQDFDQFDDLSITPTLASGIFYLESDENTIDIAGSNSLFYTLDVDFEAFSEPYVAERLLEGVVLYEVDNTTNKNLRITIEYLDGNGNQLDIESFDIPAYPSGSYDREVAYPGDKSLDILTNTTDLRVTGYVLGEDMNAISQDDAKIVLRSAGEFLFQLK